MDRHVCDLLDRLLHSNLPDVQHKLRVHLRDRLTLQIDSSPAVQDWPDLCPDLALLHNMEHWLNQVAGRGHALLPEVEPPTNSLVHGHLLHAHPLLLLEGKESHWNDVDAHSDCTFRACALPSLLPR
jgi:hypothetical protein